MATKKDSMYINLAVQASLNGTTDSPTGAIIKKGKHTISGASIWERQSIAGKFRTMAAHAECMALLSTRHAMKLLPHLLRIYGDPLISNPKVGRRGQYEKYGFWEDKIGQYVLCA